MKKNMLLLAALVPWSTAFVLAAETAAPSQPAAAAEDGERGKEKAKKPEVDPSLVKGQAAQADKLASEFGVERVVVTGLRDQGLGWGEVRHALSLSKRSGQSLDEIMRLRESGMGWGQIANKHDLKLVEPKAGASGKERKEEAGSGSRESGAGSERVKGREGSGPGLERGRARTERSGPGSGSGSSMRGGPKGRR
ncbi:MAG: hypothetical protein HY924_00155 [Elusimicrobia bacterium]|nr:hypothetical protein [Elusimicrobiota bacterium]